MCSIEDYVQNKGSALERYHREVFTYDAAFYQNWITQHAKQTFEDSKKIIDQYTLNGNSQIIPLSHFIQNATYAREQVENKKIISSENKTRTLKQEEERRAGFINASILFYAILNIGIIIAVTLIIL
jgi:hypothetical protein